jgi:hypothetical protein
MENRIPFPKTSVFLVFSIPFLRYFSTNSEIMAATTIDEVINQLEKIIKESIDTRSRIGFFAALYHKVTVRVKEGILKNEFEDGARMEQLDVVFANRYARDGAWAFAEELYGKTGHARTICIETRAATIRKLGESLKKPRGLVFVTTLIIWLFEWKNPRKITRRLNTSQKTYISATKL